MSRATSAVVTYGDVWFVRTAAMPLRVDQRACNLETASAVVLTRGSSCIRMRKAAPSALSGNKSTCGVVRPTPLCVGLLFTCRDYTCVKYTPGIPTNDVILLTQ